MWLPIRRCYPPLTPEQKTPYLAGDSQAARERSKGAPAMLWEVIDTVLTFSLGLFLVLAFITLMSNISRR